MLPDGQDPGEQNEKGKTCPNCHQPCDGSCTTNSAKPGDNAMITAVTSTTTDGPATDNCFYQPKGFCWLCGMPECFRGH